MPDIAWDIIVALAATTISAVVYAELQKDATIVGLAKRILNKDDASIVKVGDLAAVEGLCRAKDSNELISCGRKGEVSAILYD